MKLRSLRMTLLAAACCGAIGSFGWAARETAAVAEKGHEREALRVRREQLETRVARLRAVRAAMPVPSAKASVETTPRPPVESASPDWHSLIMGDPELQNLFLQAERASLAERYAAVRESLGLTEAQNQALADLIIQREEKRMDLEAIRRANRLGARDPGVTRLWEKADQAFRASVIGLLGEAGYAELARYERALPVWQLVNQFAGAVALEGEPLTGGQAAQLTETLANGSPAYRGGGEADTNTIDWPVVLSESEVILNTPQQVSFRNWAPQYPVPPRS